VISSPAVAGGVVYFGSDDGHFYAVQTGPEPKAPRSRRAVYWKDVGEKRWFEGNDAVKDHFASEGYTVLDEAGLARFLSELPEAPRSVVVAAGDALPADTVSGSRPEETPLRKYLAAGGRLIWLGLPLDAIERDPKTGQAIRFDPSRTTRLLEVDHTVGRPDWMGGRATPEGRRWGMPDWYLGGLRSATGRRHDRPRHGRVRPRERLGQELRWPARLRIRPPLGTQGNDPGPRLGSGGGGARGIGIGSSGDREIG
jgi:hypothetical protein